MNDDWEYEKPSPEEQAFLREKSTNLHSESKSIKIVNTPFFDYVSGEADITSFKRKSALEFYVTQAKQGLVWLNWALLPCVLLVEGEGNKPCFIFATSLNVNEDDAVDYVTGQILSIKETPNGNIPLYWEYPNIYGSSKKICHISQVFGIMKLPKEFEFNKSSFDFDVEQFAFRFKPKFKGVSWFAWRNYLESRNWDGVKLNFFRFLWRGYEYERGVLKGILVDSSSQEIETNMAKISRMFSEFEEVALYSFRDEDVILEDEDEKEKEQEDPENIIVTTKKGYASKMRTILEEENVADLEVNQAEEVQAAVTTAETDRQTAEKLEIEISLKEGEEDNLPVEPQPPVTETVPESVTDAVTTPDTDPVSTNMDLETAVVEPAVITTAEVESTAEPISTNRTLSDEERSYILGAVVQHIFEGQDRGYFKKEANIDNSKFLTTYMRLLNMYLEKCYTTFKDRITSLETCDVFDQKIANITNKAQFYESLNVTNKTCLKFLENLVETGLGQFKESGAARARKYDFVRLSNPLDRKEYKEYIKKRNIEDEKEDSERNVKLRNF